MPLVTFATRVCKLLGVEIMIGSGGKTDWETSADMTIATNAAGGLNPIYSVGDIVAINDVRCQISL